ncbi:leucyl aminopeptidase [Senegalia sp. (in: firmicutes)]|uniref:leucyl aminopeptidase n=1 Tax=Senegalia sp. (in: firmicutes) TaxID=1924098 RepID=UPI003F948A7C
MKISLIETKEINKYDGLILPVYEDKLELDGIDIPLDKLKKSKRFEAKLGKTYKMTISSGDKLVEVVLVGLGKKDDISYRKLLNTLADGFRSLKKENIKNMALIFNNDNIEINDINIKAAVESIMMSDYKFDDYKTDKEESEEISLDILVDNASNFEDVKKEAMILANSNIIARNLVNQPANIMNPLKLSEDVKKLGKEKGFEVEVLGLSEIKELKMDAYLSVAKASAIEPKFIIMRYKGDSENEDILGYVGKGLTYDSGGLSIKPTSGMVTMKSDMGGAAAVIGAMCAISEAKVKRNVVSVVAACENMIAGNSYRPGDIINSMGGKTIFIGNTDAEGRLTLIDAMNYIVTKENVNKVLDIATLTGAAIYCTGDAASAAISNDSEFFMDLDNSFKLSGEQIWRMPIFDEYKELIKHEEADLTNTAGNPGTVTAGLFVGEFNGDLPWIHVDIAGTAFAKKGNGILSKGGTGIAVRPLYYLAKN